MRIFTKASLTLILICTALLTTMAQVAINTDGTAPDSSSILDIKSNDRGLLIPRLNQEQRDAIVAPAAGLLIYNTSDSCFNYYTGTAWYKDCGRDLEADKTNLSPIIVGEGLIQTATDIAFDHQGAFYVAGRYNNSLTLADTTFTSVGGYDLFLLKYDANHNLRWALAMGTTVADFAPDVACDATGNVYLSGQFDGLLTLQDTTITSVADDLFLAKFNTEGTLQWITHTALSGNDGTEFGTLAIDGNSNLYLTGFYDGSGGTIGSSALGNENDKTQAYLLKCNSEGVWQWGISIPTDSYSEGYDVAVRDSIVYFSGTVSGNNTIGTDDYYCEYESGFVALFDTSGQYLHSDVFYSDDILENYAVAVDDFGNYYLGGYAYGDNLAIGDTTTAITDDYSMFIAKYDANHNFQWLTHQDNDESYVYDLAVDNNNDLIAIGDYEGTLTFDDASITSFSENGEEVYILKYSSEGEFLWVEGGLSNDTRSDQANGVNVSAENLIYLAGAFQGTITFTDTTLSSPGNLDALILPLNSEDGSQKVIDNSLANSQDGDTDPSNELQTISKSGTTVTLSDNGGSFTDEVDDADADASNELQDISLSGTSISISQGSTINLATTFTDDQTIDVLGLNGSNLEISLEGDGEENQILDLSPIDTDEQTVDRFDLSSNILEISLEGDGEAPHSVDLSEYQQTIDRFELSANTLEISLEGDNEAPLSVDLSEYQQTVDNFELDGNILKISLENDNEADLSVDLSGILVPVGTVQMWPKSSPPNGWLLCDGSSFNTATYPELTDVLNGNILPDFSGRFPLGAGDSDTEGSTDHDLYDIGGEEAHVLTISEMPSHSHGIRYQGRNKSGSGSEVSDLTGTSETDSTQSTGGGNAHNNMPPFFTINFIIKAE